MDLIIQFTALKPETIDKLLAGPGRAYFVTATGICEDSEESAGRAAGRASAWSRLIGAIGLSGPPEPADPEPVHAFDPGVGEGEREDTGKVWHGLHFCLTGQPEGGEYPLAFMDVGGHPISQHDGYQSARVFGPGETAEITASLADFGETGIRGNYDSERMIAENLYPDGAWGDPACLDSLVDAYRRVLAFLERLTRRGLGFAVQLT